MEYDRKYLLLRLLLFVSPGGNSCVWRTAGRVLFLKLRYCTAASAGGTLWCPHLSGHGSGAQIYFSEYKVSRIITCALMMLFGIIYSSFSFKGEYIIISTFIIMMKMIDAVEDVFHGNLQQKYHVEQMGKMLAARNLYSAVFSPLCLLSPRACTAPVLLLLQPPLFCVLSLTHR